MDLETQPGKEFSYPAIIAIGPGRVALTYTWRRESVAFWMIDSEDLR